MAFQVKVLTEQAQALLTLSSTLERDNRLLKQRAAAGRYALRFTQLLSSSIAAHRADTATVESILRTPHSKAAVLHQLEEQIHLLTQLAPGITHMPPEEALPQDVRMGSWTSTSSSSGSSSTSAAQGGDSSTLLNGLQDGQAPALVFRMDPVQFFKVALQHYDWASTTYDIDLAAARELHATLRSGLTHHLQELASADTPEAAATASSSLLDSVARFWATVGQGAVLAPQVVYQVCTVNLDTGLPDTPTREHLAYVTDAMCLTQEQKQQVADLLVAFQALQRPHLQQRQQLQQVIAACGSSMSSVVDPAAPAAAQAAAQQQQQPQEAGSFTRTNSGTVQISPEYTLQLTKQLDSIMRKLAWLEYCLTTLLLCTVGLQQFACFAVAMHPHPLRFVVWAAHVTESLKESPASEQQQQQQQQHAAAAAPPQRVSTTGNAAKKLPAQGQQQQQQQRVGRQPQLAPPVPQQAGRQQQQQQKPAVAPAGLGQHGLQQGVSGEQLPWAASCSPAALQLQGQPIPKLPTFAACGAGSRTTPLAGAPAGGRQQPPVEPSLMVYPSLHAAPTAVAATTEQSLVPPVGQAAGPPTQQQQQQQHEEEGAMCAQGSGLQPLHPGLDPAAAAAAALVQDGDLEPALAGLLCELRGVLTSEGTPSQLALDLALNLA